VTTCARTRARTSCAWSACALVAVASWTPVCQDPWWQQSRLIPTVEMLAVQARDFLPGSLREIIGSCRAASPPEAPLPPKPAV